MTPDIETPQALRNSEAVRSIESMDGVCHQMPNAQRGGTGTSEVRVAKSRKAKLNSVAYPMKYKSRSDGSR